MPKNFTTSASEQDYISLLELGCTWPWGSVIKGFWGRKKNVFHEMLNISCMHTAPFFFLHLKKKIVIIKGIRVVAQINLPHLSQ